jgi:hypothetical protein
MPTVRHAVQKIAFQGMPEARQVFARNSNGEIEYLENGAAQTFKDRRAAGETFSCVVPSCESPELTVVDRKQERRDGFAHLSNGAHPGMGVAHLQSQLLVQRWIQERYPSLRVELEMTTEDGTRRADVMVVSPNTGARIAFEIQYAGMTPQEWEARHQSYRDQGIVDIWLWGYGGEHVRPDNSEPGRIRGSITLRSVSASGSTIFFIDPAWGQLGYVSCEPEPFAVPKVRALSLDGRGTLQSEPLNAFWFNADRELVSEALTALIRGGEIVSSALERARAAEHARELRRERAAERFFDRIAQKAAAAEREWNESVDQKRILALFGSVPSVLRHLPLSGNTPILLPVPPVVWQSHFYLRHIHGRPLRWQA